MNMHWRLLLEPVYVEEQWLLKTGFNPYIKEGQICFDHRWLLLIGKKEN